MGPAGPNFPKHAFSDTEEQFFFCKQFAVVFLSRHHVFRAEG